MHSDSFIAEISCPKDWGQKHVGIWFSDGRVAHCARRRGEHISTIDEFAAGHDVTIERMVPLHEHAATLARIAEAMRSPKAYDIVNNNCEMFVRRMLGEKVESPQLQGAILVIGLAAVLGLAAARS